MSKFFFAVLLVIATLAVMAQGVLVYQLSATAALIAEEETHDDKPTAKDTKDSSKDKIVYTFEFYKYSFVKKLHHSALDHGMACSKGFYDQPYNPPEVI